MARMKKTRLAALLLAVLTVLSVSALSACSTSGNGTTVTTGSSAATQTTEAVTTVAVPEIMEEGYFDDYTCNILLGLTTLGRNEFIAADSSTVMGNAIYTRAETMKEKYGVSITTDEHYTGGYSSFSSLSKEYISGDTTFDMCICRILDIAKLTVNGYLYDLTDVPHLDLSKPWWDQSVVKDSTIAGSVYFASGDISTLVNDFVCCVAFNKDMFKTATGEDTSVLYKLVADGEWTLDKLDEYSKFVSEDLNLDNIYDSRDKFGLTIWDSRVVATVHAGGDKIVTLGDDGLMTLTLYSERAAAAVEKLINISLNDYCLNMSGMSGGVDWKTIFKDGKALFTMASFNSLDYFRNLETDYGILPQPKNSADQGSYYSSIVSVHASFFCMPAIQEDAGRSGAIAELLGYIGQDTLTPAYYEKTLVGTYIRDDESADAIDICFSTKVVDLGDYFAVGDYYNQLAQLLDNKNPTGFTSMYETRLPTAEKTISDYNEQIASLKD